MEPTLTAMYVPDWSGGRGVDEAGDAASRHRAVAEVQVLQTRQICHRVENVSLVFIPADLAEVKVRDVALRMDRLYTARNGEVVAAGRCGINTKLIAKLPGSLV